MKRRSPTLGGFRTIFRRPSFGLAEIAWRWSFGALAGLLLGFALIEYADTLPVSKGDLFLLRTGQPALISRAVLHIFRGSGFRLVETAVVLAVTLGACWVVIASFGRAATVNALLSHFREGENPTTKYQGKQMRGLRSLLGLNFLRLGATLAASVGCIAAFLLGGAVSGAKDSAPGSALLIILTIIMLVWLAWSTLNWCLSLASIFAVADGENTFGAITAAVNLCYARPGAVSAVGIWFGLAHVTAFVVASSVIAFPLGFAAILPGGIVLGGVVLITLLYSAIADFLYMGRLAAYVAIVELPDTPVEVPIAPPAFHQPGSRLDAKMQSDRIDASELILSDIPASS